MFADHVNAHSLIRDVHTTCCVAESGLGLTGFIYNLLFVFSISQFEGKFGFLNVEISNGNPHTKLTATFYDNKGSNVLDEFTIEKEIKNMKSEVKYIDADTNATGVLLLKGNNTDNMPQQANVLTDIEASNILPVKNNISNTGTYKILPSYSELNEKWKEK